MNTLGGPFTWLGIGTNTYMGIYSIFHMDLVGTYGRLFWSMIDRFILLSYGLRVWGFGGADLTWVRVWHG